MPIEFQVPDDANGDDELVGTQHRTPDYMRGFREGAKNYFEEGVVEGKRRAHEEHDDASDSGWLMLLAGVVIGVAMAGAYIWIYKLIIE